MQITPEILSDLRKLVLITGNLSEVHINTLKTAPFIFFDKVKEVQISHNIKAEDSSGMPGLGSQVGFVIFFEEDYSPDLLKERTLALKNTVHTILWPEVSVTITDSNGKDLCQK